MNQSFHLLANFVQNNDQIFSKQLGEIAKKVNSKGCPWPAVLASIATTGIKDVALGPDHIAFLLNDGRVCRTSVNVYADKLDSNRGNAEKGIFPSKTLATSNAQPQIVGQPSSAPSGGVAPAAPPSGGVAATPGSTVAAVSAAAAVAVSNSSSLTSKAAKIRRVMMARGRLARGVIVNSRPLLPASAVPEDLIAQAQVVLQGKSRDVIVRELQRTNLDVNQAVNNLLSRDDDDGDEFEDAADSYMSEDLISLLDSGLHGDQASVIIDADALYGDDVWGYASVRRRTGDKDKYADSSGAKDPNVSKSNAAVNAQGTVGSPNGAPVVLGSHLDFWSDKETGQSLKFEKIGAMYSELVALATDGRLYQWKWDAARPQSGLHPKIDKLNLTDEKIVHLSCAYLRCTISTSTNKLASFSDGFFGPEVGSALDTPAFELTSSQLANEQQADGSSSFAGPFQSVHASNFVSCVRTKSNLVYWWGIVPFNERRKNWEKNRLKCKKHANHDSNEIVVGSQVRMKTNPLYNAGSVALTMVNGYPQLGILMESAWTLTETCRFQMVKDPASLQLNSSASGVEKSLCETSAMDVSSQLSHKTRKRQASTAFKDDSSQVSSCKEEAWNLIDVIFIEENTTLLNGNVIKVDGPYCVVVFPDAEGKLVTDAQKIMANCRLFRKEDLILISKVNCGLLRSPGVFQRETKQLTLGQRDKIIEMAITNNSILTLQSRQNKIIFTRYNFSGKIFEEHVVCQHSNLFLGVDSAGRNKLINGGEPTSLMEHITHCDYESVKQFMADMEREKNIDKAQQEIADARLDGNQNLLHACVSMSVPPTNQQNADHNPSMTSSTSVGGSTSAPSTSNVVASLESAAASAARAVYEAKWEQMISGSRGQLMSVEESMQMASRPIRWGDVTSSPSYLPNAAGQMRHLQPGTSVVAPGAYQQPHLDFSPSTAASSAAAAASAVINWPMEVASDTVICTSPSEGNSAMATDLSSMSIPVQYADSLRDTISKLSNNVPLPVFPKIFSDPKERQQNAQKILKFLCERPSMAHFLPDLLTLQDQDGMTPFLSAVNKRMYSAAVQLWDAAKLLSQALDCKDLLENSIFPKNTDLDDSPLFLLCYNDTCSFTWTGDEHINQDIFECRTCGLVGTLCCCSECAFVCHKGHDCKLKRTSPTAYCDCWEKCKCKALIVGNQAQRMELYTRILNETDLFTKCNKKGEHALLFLVKTVGRQATEQRQYRMSRSRGAKAMDIYPDMPEHDLEPPRFARKALEKMLVSWPAIKSLLLIGCRQKQQQTSSDMHEDKFALLSQHSVTQLDKFCHALTAKCPSDLLDIFLSTLIKELHAGDKETERLVARFVRSVVRIFCVLNLAHISGSSRSNRKSYYSQPTLKCRRVFQALISFAIKEMASVADGIFAPIRLGFVRSAQPFTPISSSTDAADMVEKLFSADYQTNSLDSTINAFQSLNKKRGNISNENVENRPTTNHLGSSRLHSSRNDENDSEQDVDSDSDSDYDDNVGGGAVVASDRRPLAGGAAPTLYRDQPNRGQPIRRVGADLAAATTAPLAYSDDDGNVGGVIDGSASDDDDDDLSIESATSGADDDEEGDDGVGEGRAATTSAVVETGGEVQMERPLTPTATAPTVTATLSVSGDLATANASLLPSIPSGQTAEEGGDQQHAFEEDDYDAGAPPPSSRHPRRRRRCRRRHRSLRRRQRSSATALGANADDDLDLEEGGADEAADDVGGAHNVDILNATDDVVDDDEEDDDEDEEDEEEEEDDDEVASKMSDTEDDLDGEHTNESDFDMEHSFVPGHRSDRFIAANTLAPPTLRWAMRLLTPRESAAQNAASLPPTPPVGGSAQRSSHALASNDNTSSNLVFLDSPSFAGNRRSVAAASAASTHGGSASGAGIGGGTTSVGNPFTATQLPQLQTSMAGGAGVSAAAPSLDASGPLPPAMMANVANVADGSGVNIGGGSSTAFASVALARLFATLVRHVTDFLATAYDYQRLGPSLPRLLTITKEDAAELQHFVERQLHPTWLWLKTVLDSTESQLKFCSALICQKFSASPPEDGSGVGASFFRQTGFAGVGAGSLSTATADDATAAARVLFGSSTFTAQSATPADVRSRAATSATASHTSAENYESANASARRDFMHYALSLMRAHSDEHGDELPTLKLGSLRHVAHVLDGLLYFLSNANGASTDQPPPSFGRRQRSSMATQRRAGGADYRSSDNSADAFPADYRAAVLEGRAQAMDYANTMDDYLDDSQHVDGNHRFFTRSDSMTYPGLYPMKMPHEYSITDSMPLVERPDLLQPDSTVETYFGVKHQPMNYQNHQALCNERGQTHSIHLGLSSVDFSSTSSDLKFIGSSALKTPTKTTPAPSFGSMTTAAPSAISDASTPVSKAVHHLMHSALERVTSGETVDAPSTPSLLETSSSPTAAPQRAQSVIVHACSVVQQKSSPRVAPQSSAAASFVSQEVASKFKEAKERESGVPSTYLAAPNQAQLLMSRWRLAINVMAKAFSEEVGQEPGSVLIQLAGFPIKATRFRKEMERLRNSLGKDLVLEVERSRNLLIQCTIRQLNQFYGRRQSCVVSPAIAVHKVKVTFKDEPGEGSGVARTFYTAIAEAFLSQEKLPNLDLCQATSLAPNPAPPSSNKMQQQLLNRLRTREREREVQRRRTTGVNVAVGVTAGGTGRRYRLSADAPPYFPSSAAGGGVVDVVIGGSGVGATPSPAPMPHSAVTAAAGSPSASSLASGNNSAPSGLINWDPSKQALGDRLLPKVRAVLPSLPNKITGMLLELPPHQLLMLLASDEALRIHVAEAHSILVANNIDAMEHQTSATEQASQIVKINRKSISSPNLPTIPKNQILDPDEIMDDAPLFFDPSGSGFFTPVPGKGSAERLNAFRNVGRIIGVCLLQNELLPLSLCRHVLKFILGRSANWYDLAFFDKRVFESMRDLMSQASCAHEHHKLADYCLTFSLHLLPEEGGGDFELKKDGSNIQVTSENFSEYVYRYVDLRLTKLAIRPLEALRDGIFDVLPSYALDGLTAEDFRLLLCGTAKIDVNVLQSYASFADESSAPGDQLAKFKKWFWSVVLKMTAKEKQDLVYFWTGSPALPSNEEGFQPLPSVMIRPADDHHLPTANTCISRLYVPLYSSKQILRHKLSMAIKTKIFGFV